MISMSSQCATIGMGLMLKISSREFLSSTSIFPVEEPIKTFTPHTVRGSKEVISLILFVVAPK